MKQVNKNSKKLAVQHKHMTANDKVKLPKDLRDIKSSKLDKMVSFLLKPIKK